MKIKFHYTTMKIKFNYTRNVTNVNLFVTARKARIKTACREGRGYERTIMFKRNNQLKKARTFEDLL